MQRITMVLFALVPTVARAATLEVCDSCAYTTISAAVSAAAPGDTVSIAADTYTEDIEITTSLNLIGAGSGSTFLYNSSASDEAAITVAGPVDVTVTGLTVDDASGANSDTGIVVSGATVSFTDLHVQNQTFHLSAEWDGRDGGGMSVIDGAVVSIVDSAFQGNSGHWGGALFIDSSTVSIESTVFSENYAGYGAGIHTDGALLEITSSTFFANVAESEGGGIHTGHNAGWNWLNIEDTSFTANEATYGGVAISASPGATLNLDTVAVDFHVGGSEFDLIPAVEMIDGTLSVVSSTFTGNRGGAIEMSQGTMIVHDSTFEENDSTGWHPEGWPNGHGGAISMSQGHATITDSRFSRNSADLGGGAISLTHSEGGEISGSTFTGNRAPGAAAVALGVYGGSFVFRRNIVCANEATGGSGGLFLSSAGGTGTSWEVTNNVFAENTAPYGGAITYASGTHGTFRNNTLLGNAAQSAGGAALVDANFTWVNNIVAETASGDGLSSWDDVAPATAIVRYGAWHLNTASDLGGAFAALPLDTTNIQSDPRISAWSADGDCSNDEFWLGAGSPAIDAGDPAYQDADGTRSDIGAYGGLDPLQMTESTDTDAEDSDPPDFLRDSDSPEDGEASGGGGCSHQRGPPAWLALATLLTLRGRRGR